MRKLTFLFTLLIFLGCSKDDSKNEEPQEQDPNATIADNVEVILAENSELISSESELSSGIYKIQFNQSVPEIEPSDIIVGDEGLGFLRKVTSISSSNNILTMQTSQANMEDVFGNTNINFTTDLSNFNKSSSGKSNSNSSYQRTNYEHFAKGVTRNQNNFALDFTNVLINSNSSGSFTITNGSVTYNPNYVFDIDYSLFSLNKLYFGTENTTFNAQATINLNTTDMVTLPLTEYVLYENSKTFVKPVGKIPLVVTLFFKLKAKSELEVGNTISLSKTIEHNTTFSLGATYENDNWTPLTEINAGFVEHPVNLNGSYINLTKKISLVPEVIIAFYGINGPLIEPTPSVNLGVNVGANDNWDAFVNANFKLNVGASIGIFGKTLISLPFDSYLETEDYFLWNAPDSIEVISGNNQTGNQEEQLSDPLKVRVWDNSGLFYLKEVPVYFNVTSGNGTVSNESVLTDDNGFAEVNWTLGNNTEPQTVEVTVKKADATNIESLATFSANSEDNEIDLSGTWSGSTDPQNPGICSNGDNGGNWNISFTFNEDNNTIVFTSTSNHSTANESTSYSLSNNQLNFSINVSLGGQSNFCNGPVGWQADHTLIFNGTYDETSNSFSGEFTNEHNLSEEFPECGFVSYTCTRPMTIN